MQDAAVALVALLALARPAAAQFAYPCTRASGAAAAFYGAQVYHTDRRFDSNRASVPLGPGASFTRVQANMYTEWGLPHPVTLITNVSVQRLEYATPTGSQVNFGFGNPELGLMFDVNEVWGLKQLFCAVSVVVKLPFVSPGQPLLGFEQTDVEIRARSLGGIPTRWGGWWVTDLAYRHRYGDPADEVRAEGTVGVRVARHWTVLGQASVTASLQDSVVALGLNPNLAPNYLSGSGQLSVLYRLTRTQRLQIGVQHEFLGRNSSNGTALAVTLWHFFDYY